MTDSPTADIARAEELTECALAAEPRSFRSHMAKGQVLRAQGRFDEAITAYETVIELNRNAAYAISSLANASSLQDPWTRRSRCSCASSASARAIPLSVKPMSESGLRIWYNRELKMRSSGSKRRAAPSPNFRMFTRFSLPPMRSKARPNALQLNSPQPASLARMTVIRASRA
jgi:tetratricopeptide (TPR) repeat protein